MHKFFLYTFLNTKFIKYYYTHHKTKKNNEQQQPYN